MTSLLVLDRAKAVHLAAVAAEQFPVPRQFLDEAVEEILSGVPQGEPGGRLPAPAGPYLPVEPREWPAARTSMAAALRASATPDREDRLVPGDIAQFATAGGGICFGYGIAGVLHALAETGAGPWPEAEEWLLDRTGEPASGTALGFYDGLAGTAWTLHRLGHRGRALALAERLLHQPWESAGPDLHSGLAGIGLALDALGTASGESELHTAALRCAELLARPEQRPTRAGLLYGNSGPALLFVRLYERTGDKELLVQAAQAHHRDLDRCVTSAYGTLQVNEGWRTMASMNRSPAATFRTARTSRPGEPSLST